MRNNCDFPLGPALISSCVSRTADARISTTAACFRAPSRTIPISSRKYIRCVVVSGSRFWTTVREARLSSSSVSERSSSSIGSEAGGGVGAAASHVPKQAAIVTGAGRHFKRGRNEAEVKFANRDVGLSE